MDGLSSLLIFSESGSASYTCEGRGSHFGLSVSVSSISCFTAALSAAFAGATLTTSIPLATSAASASEGHSGRHGGRRCSCWSTGCRWGT